MKLRFTPRATQDISEIAAYVQARDPDAATRVRDSILDAMQTIALFPKAGRRQEVERVRKHLKRPRVRSNRDRAAYRFGGMIAQPMRT
jgi:plasmid stabilization system protein ParE